MILKSSEKQNPDAPFEPQIQIKIAQLSDAKELSELIRENAQKLLHPHYDVQQWNVFIKYYAAEALAKKIAEQVVFFAEKEGQIVGTVALDGDFVVGFYTRLQNVKQGIGKLLMGHLESYAKGEGLTKLQLASSPEGLAFYYKNGWKKVKNFTAEYCGIGFEEILMTKEIS